VIEALQEARRAGKTRFIGYSGDNERALWAVNSGHFDTLQLSFNLVDQSARHKLFGLAREQNMGIIVKRPVANGVWGTNKAPSEYAAKYFARAEKMRALGAMPAAPNNGILLALGFVLAHDLVDTAIVGTLNPAHMQANITWVNTQLPIAEEVVSELMQRFELSSEGETWMQLE